MGQEASKYGEDEVPGEQRGAHVSKASVKQRTRAWSDASSAAASVSSERFTANAKSVETGLLQGATECSASREGYRLQAVQDDEVAAREAKATKKRLKAEKRARKEAKRKRKEEKRVAKLAAATTEDGEQTAEATSNTFAEIVHAAPTPRKAGEEVHEDLPAHDHMEEKAFRKVESKDDHKPNPSAAGRPYSVIALQISGEDPKSEVVTPKAAAVNAEPEIHSSASNNLIQPQEKPTRSFGASTTRRSSLDDVPARVEKKVDSESTAGQESLSGRHKNRSRKRQSEDVVADEDPQPKRSRLQSHRLQSELQPATPLLQVRHNAQRATKSQSPVPLTHEMPSIPLSALHSDRTGNSVPMKSSSPAQSSSNVSKEAEVPRIPRIRTSKWQSEAQKENARKKRKKQAEKAPRMEAIAVKVRPSPGTMLPGMMERPVVMQGSGESNQRAFHQPSEPVGKAEGAKNNQGDRRKPIHMQNKKASPSIRELAVEGLPQVQTKRVKKTKKIKNKKNVLQDAIQGTELKAAAVDGSASLVHATDPGMQDATQGTELRAAPVDRSASSVNATDPGMQNERFERPSQQVGRSQEIAVEATAPTSSNDNPPGENDQHADTVKDTLIGLSPFSQPSDKRVHVIMDDESSMQARDGRNDGKLEFEVDLASPELDLENENDSEQSQESQDAPPSPVPDSESGFPVQYEQRARSEELGEQGSEHDVVEGSQDVNFGEDTSAPMGTLISVHTPLLQNHLPSISSSEALAAEYMPEPLLKPTEPGPSNVSLLNDDESHTVTKDASAVTRTNTSSLQVLANNGSHTPMCAGLQLQNLATKALESPSWTMDQYEDVLADVLGYLNSQPGNWDGVSREDIENLMNDNPTLPQWLMGLESLGLTFDRGELMQVLKNLMPLEEDDTIPKVLESQLDLQDSSKNPSRQDEVLEYIAEQLLFEPEKGILPLLGVHLMKDLCQEMGIVVDKDDPNTDHIETQPRSRTNGGPSKWATVIPNPCMTPADSSTHALVCPSIQEIAQEASALLLGSGSAAFVETKDDAAAKLNEVQDLSISEVESTTEISARAPEDEVMADRQEAGFATREDGMHPESDSPKYRGRPMVASTAHADRGAVSGIAAVTNERTTPEFSALSEVHSPISEHASNNTSAMPRADTMLSKATANLMTISTDSIDVFLADGQFDSRRNPERVISVTLTESAAQRAFLRGAKHKVLQAVKQALDQLDELPVSLHQGNQGEHGSDNPSEEYGPSDDLRPNDFTRNAVIGESTHSHEHGTAQQLPRDDSSHANQDDEPPVDFLKLPQKQQNENGPTHLRSYPGKPPRPEDLLCQICHDLCKNTWRYDQHTRLWTCKLCHSAMLRSTAVDTEMKRSIAQPIDGRCQKCQDDHGDQRWFFDHATKLWACFACFTALRRDLRGHKSQLSRSKQSGCQSCNRSSSGPALRIFDKTSRLWLCKACYTKSCESRSSKGDENIAEEPDKLSFNEKSRSLPPKPTDFKCQICAKDNKWRKWHFDDISDSWICAACHQMAERPQKPDDCALCQACGIGSSERWYWKDSLRQWVCNKCYGKMDSSQSASPRHDAPIEVGPAVE